MKKDNENYVNSQKKVAFQLKPVDYSLFLKKDDEDDQSNGGGGFYNSYVSWSNYYYSFFQLSLV